jgi:Domain of unknown function (DUF4917)
MTPQPLLDWREFTGAVWPSLILGNGASINVWSGFRYARLYDEAPLSHDARKLFENLGTTNFEEVLGAVYHARLVDAALGRDHTQAAQLYEHIRTALFDGVRKVHIPWTKAGVTMLESYALALYGFDSVYTTNYDLLPYWSAMATDESRRRFKDMFWGPGSTFDPADTRSYGLATTIYYLHGGLHLWADQEDGSCGKWRADSSTLLEPDRFAARPSRIPLFVSEGSAKEKLRTIGRWQYLRHAAEKLLGDHGNIIVLAASWGHRTSTSCE